MCKIHVQKQLRLRPGKVDLSYCLKAAGPARFGSPGSVVWEGVGFGWGVGKPWSSMMLSKLVFPLHHLKRPHAWPLPGLIWLPQHQALKTGRRGRGDAGMVFSLTSTFC